LLLVKFHWQNLSTRCRPADLSSVAPAKSEVLVDGSKFSIIRLRPLAFGGQVRKRET